MRDKILKKLNEKRGEKLQENKGQDAWDEFEQGVLRKNNKIGRSVPLATDKEFAKRKEVYVINLKGIPVLHSYDRSAIEKVAREAKGKFKDIIFRKVYIKDLGTATSSKWVVRDQRIF